MLQTHRVRLQVHPLLRNLISVPRIVQLAHSRVVARSLVRRCAYRAQSVHVYPSPVQNMCARRHRWRVKVVHNSGDVLEEEDGEEPRIGVVVETRGIRPLHAGREDVARRAALVQRDCAPTPPDGAAGHDAPNEDPRLRSSSYELEWEALPLHRTARCARPLDGGEVLREEMRTWRRGRLRTVGRRLIM